MYFLFYLFLLRTVYLNVLPDCFCSNASASSSWCCSGWNTPTADTELAWLLDATSCTSVHTSVKLKRHRIHQTDLPKILAQTWDVNWAWHFSAKGDADVSRLKKVASAPLLVKVNVRHVVWPTTCVPKSMN